jgi:hypothetical protein
MARCRQARPSLVRVSRHVHAGTKALGAYGSRVTGKEASDFWGPLLTEAASDVTLLLDRSSERQRSRARDYSIEGNEARVADRHLWPSHQAPDLVHATPAEAAGFWRGAVSGLALLIAQDADRDFIARAQVGAEVLDLAFAWLADADVKGNSISLAARDPVCGKRDRGDVVANEPGLTIHADLEGDHCASSVLPLD